MKLEKGYVLFYLDGREAKVLRGDIDPEELADKVIAGEGCPHDVTHKAVTDAAKTLEFGKHKKQWLNDNEDDVKAQKLDSAKAFSTYLAGRIDEAVNIIEVEVVDAMSAIMAEEDGEEDDDDDDDNDEEGEDGKDK